jgi:preprotein translocase subunit SecE
MIATKRDIIIATIIVIVVSILVYPLAFWL